MCIKIVLSFLFFFFFQAEDGIRDLTVTGVQTCALPIFRGQERLDRVDQQELILCAPTAFKETLAASQAASIMARATGGIPLPVADGGDRSEERRVGKECRSRWSPDAEKKKQEA